MALGCGNVLYTCFKNDEGKVRLGLGSEGFHGISTLFNVSGLQPCSCSLKQCGHQGFLRSQQRELVDVASRVPRLQWNVLASWLEVLLLHGESSYFGSSAECSQACLACGAPRSF